MGGLGGLRGLGRMGDLRGLGRLGGLGGIGGGRIFFWFLVDDWTFILCSSFANPSLILRSSCILPILFV